MEKVVSIEGYMVGFHQDCPTPPPLKVMPDPKPTPIEESSIFSPLMQMAKDFMQKQVVLSQKLEALEKDFTQAVRSVLSPPQQIRPIPKRYDPPKALPTPQAPMELPDKNVDSYFIEVG